MVNLKNPSTFYETTAANIISTPSKPIRFFYSELRGIAFLVWIIGIAITPKFFQRLYSIILCPFNQRDSIKFLYTSIVHFIFEIPLYNRLISLMKKLLDFPNNHLATGIPFLKPMLYCFSVVILGTPAFCIDHIFCKNIINAHILLIEPHIKP